MSNPRWKPFSRIHKVETPAAGAEFSVTPNTAAGWLIWSIRFRFVTGAAVATRAVTLSLSDGETEYARYGPRDDQVASLDRVYSGFMGCVAGSSAAPIVAMDFPTPGIWLPQGHTLRTITDAIQAADQHSAIALYLTEFPTGPDLTMWPSPVMYGPEENA